VSADLRATEARYRTLFDYAHAGILLADSESRYLDANPRACEMLGYTHDELVGLHASDIVTSAEAGHVPSALYDIHRSVEHQREWQFRRKDGSVFPAEVIATKMPDGTVLGMIRDISSLKERDNEIARLSRLYAALSHINQAIVRLPNREELFQRVCRVLVEDGGFCMAWVGWHDEATRRIEPVAAWGDESGYLQLVVVSTDEQPEGSGPSGSAFRTGNPCVCNDLLEDPATLPWRPGLERGGFRASAAFPIRLKGMVKGTLNVYSQSRGFFHDREVALLEEAATDLSFALDNLVREEERRLAEQTVHNEKTFSDAMLESMPGVLYFYDNVGRFLRWNRNFQTLSGYSADEISRMHPLEFFVGEDKERVGEAIAEVFQCGESAVEAAFRAKDGSSAPYFFTGKHVVFEGTSCLVGVGIDISARRQAEALLVENERKYRELVEHANSIILRWNAEGRITFLNEFGQQFFGYSAEEIVGSHVVGTIVPTTESSGRDLGRLMEEILENPQVFEQNINENVRRNGERVWISWTNRIVRDAEGRVVEFLSIGTDITERRRAEERLRESEAHLVAAQRIARIGSWELNLGTNKLRWSEQIAEMFGIPMSVFGGTYEAFLEYVHPGDRDRLQAAQEATIAGGPRLDLEHRIVLRDGTEKVVHELADLKRDEAGAPVALAGTVHDITDRVRIQEERERRHRAEAADRIKSAFLATMSHELRTPLNSIIGFTGIVLQGLAGPLNPEQIKQLGMVRSSARHLLELIKDVLDISKIEAGQLEVRAELFDLHAALERAVASVRPLAEKKGLTLSAFLAPELREMVSDGRRVEQIVLNLLNNALKFTDHGGVTLRAERIDGYRCSPQASSTAAVRLCVSDTGIGIRPDDLASLFQPFRQLDAGLTREHEGTGLGLAICRRLAELLGGEISASSTWQQGSEFTVVLPLRRPD